MGSAKCMLAVLVLGQTMLLTACQSLDVGSVQGSEKMEPQLSHQTVEPSVSPLLLSRPMVPTLAYDDRSLVLAWNKPDNGQQIVDYRVYQNGQPLGLSSQNNTTHNPAKPYMDKFFAEDKAGFHQRSVYLNFKVKHLQPATEYHFSVAAIYADGRESPRSPVLTTETAAPFSRVVDIRDFGAIADGLTVNTKPIQAAIDTCSVASTSAYGCKVLIPSTNSGKAFVSGALFLKSNMTLEIAAGAVLKGSENADDYPLGQGYQLYSYRTNTTDSRRPPSLLNALNPHQMNAENHSQHGYDYRRGRFNNIRIVGEGTIDGGGWLRGKDTQDELGRSLAYYPAGSRAKVYRLGLLAKDQMQKAYRQFNPAWDGDTDEIDYQAQLHRDLYSNRRSSLATFRGVRDIYFAGLTLLNPAYHGVMFLEAENTVFAYNSVQTFDINNADGVEFGNSGNSLIFANFIDSGDDCINFAAGQGADYHLGSAHVQATDGAWIFNNYTREGHGMVVAGSHTGAWIQNILAEENVAFMTDNGLRMKSTPATGGGARNITFRNNAMKDIGTQNSHQIDGLTIENRGRVGNPFVFTLAYKMGDNVFESAPKAAQFRDIVVQDVSLDNVDSESPANYWLKIDGYDGADQRLVYPETFQQNFLFEHVRVKNTKVSHISRLKGAVFRDVTIESWENAATSPWQLSDSENIQFIDVTPPINH
ncbi:glycosyl hydrolase family 28 protein [Agarivorans sp. QJM3NY_33]|uniref:glycosyl hydrolase family 28 protein n=1 Tax=Agarivorans sp. QJM3NY_33 TaxID=3421432 RepID=UPI003D7DB758